MADSTYRLPWDEDFNAPEAVYARKVREYDKVHTTDHVLPLDYSPVHPNPDLRFLYFSTQGLNLLVPPSNIYAGHDSSIDYPVSRLFVSTILNGGTLVKAGCLHGSRANSGVLDGEVAMVKDDSDTEQWTRQGIYSGCTTRTGNVKTTFAIVLPEETLFSSRLYSTKGYPLPLTLAQSIYVHDEEYYEVLEKFGILDLMSRLSMFSDHTPTIHQLMDFMGDGNRYNGMSKIFPDSKGDKPGIYRSIVSDVLSDVRYEHIDAEIVAALLHREVVLRMLNPQQGDEVEDTIVNEQGSTLIVKRPDHKQHFEDLQAEALQKLEKLKETNNPDLVKQYAKFLYGMFGKILSPEDDPFMLELENRFGLHRNDFDIFLHACANSTKIIELPSGKKIAIKDIHLDVLRTLDMRTIGEKAESE